MKITLIDYKNLVNLVLPTNIFGDYWLADADKNNLICIEAFENSWVLKSNSEVKIISNNNIVPSIKLETDSFYYLKNITTNEIWTIYCSAFYDASMHQLIFKKEARTSIFIGNNTVSPVSNSVNNWLSYDHPAFAYNQLEIVFMDNSVYVKNLNEKIPLYVNNNRVINAKLTNGDNIFILGLRLSIINDILLFNNPGQLVKYDPSKFIVRNLPKLDYSAIDETVDNYVEVFAKKDYFLRPPRFNERVEPKEVTIEAPPASENGESMPVFLTLGPMLIMGMAACVRGAVALIEIGNGTTTFGKSYPAILTAGTMILAMIVFPSLVKRYEARRKAKREKKRQEKYREYIDNKRKAIFTEMKKQKQILIDNNIPLKDVADIIAYRKRNLWERKETDDDFLELRLGIGTIPPFIKIRFPEEGFSLETDELKEYAQTLVEEVRTIDQVPVTFSFTKKFISAIIGQSLLVEKFMDGLLLQMVARHAYDNLKIVIFTNDSSANDWNEIKNTAYCWDNEKTIRFYGTETNEINQISNYLEEILTIRRIEASSNNSNDKTPRNYYENYVIITDDVDLIRGVGIISDILKLDRYMGFSVIINTNKLNSLPSECSAFISIDKNSGGIFENELVSNKKVSFVPDYPTFDLNNYFYAVANIPIDIAHGNFVLPKAYTFLEMYGVSNIKQLNSFNRWKSNNPTTSLQAPVGINESGELFKLDLHEKAHGPHGLIAGMTGSGKSEFIITYILSMAVNYHPNDVSFVIIDYKGGGLAGALENKETGVKLPHLAGTITNLDINEINRSLSSLQSELKRRQTAFNKARDILSESTVDIYKYQKLYREGKVKEPISHLFIISDEFAELKAQQPDFMSQLISTARIGRGLGVHLILSTQKPSGVVDDQIWSNSKFRVCLKVQDKKDSMDLIRSPDAALLKEAGRFYLQVGYNEYFALGQSAWCGAPYYETDKRKKKIDTALNFIDNIGFTIKSIENEKNKINLGIHRGEELPNVLKYLIETAAQESVKVKSLWLDRIPDEIYINKLKEKYDYQTKPYFLNPIIGEYDVPSEQRQGLLNLPISNDGNALIYGAVGSGKEDLLSAIIYSLIVNHSTEEVNIYLMDFGSEALKIYRSAPQIGDIVLASDNEKLVNLLKLLKKNLDERKRLFSDYGGSYNNYIKAAKEKLPNIVVIINHLQIFNELFTKYEDILIQLIRDSQKYGIYFIATTVSPNAIRFKLSQNFKQKITLQLNDNGDYSSVVGRTKMIPFKTMGRGLVKLEDVYEFQTALPYKRDYLNDYIKAICVGLKKKNQKTALRIPVLPTIVSCEYVRPSLKGITSIPIGIEKETLEVRTIDIKNRYALLISAQELKTTETFTQTFTQQLTEIEGLKTFILDAEKMFTKAPENTSYFNSGFNEVINKLNEYVEDMYQKYTTSGFDEAALNNYQHTVCLITGIEKFKNLLTIDHKKMFDNIMEKAKNLYKFSFILVDSIDNIRKSEYDSWYKSMINSSRGIWIGNGITDQMTLKILKTTPEMREELSGGYGYDIYNGNPCLIKYIESYDQDDEYEIL